MEVDIQELKNSIENLHGGKAIFLESVPVSELFEGKKVWEGVVQVFALNGNPIASKCFAWSHEIEGSTKRRFFTILQVPPINTPRDAVKAAIVQEYRSKGK